MQKTSIVTKKALRLRVLITVGIFLVGAAALAAYIISSGYSGYQDYNQANYTNNQANHSINQANQDDSSNKCVYPKTKKEYNLNITFNIPGSYKIEVSKDGIYMIESGGSGYQNSDLSADGSKWIIYFSVPAGTLVPKRFLVAKLFYCSEDYIAFTPTVTRLK